MGVVNQYIDKLMDFIKNRNAEGAKSAMKIHILHAIKELEIE